MSDTSGRTSRTPFAFYDPASRSLRTSQDTFDLGFPTSSPTLPRSGSMRSGRLYERPTSVPLTSGSGCSSSPLLKTPTAQLAINGGSQHPDKRKVGGHGPTLADEVEHLLPTPRATDTGTPGRRASEGWRPPLSQVVIPLMPTPTASDSKSSSGANPAWGHGETLTDAARSVGAGSPPALRAGKRSRAFAPPGQLTIEDA